MSGECDKAKFKNYLQPFNGHREVCHAAANTEIFDSMKNENDEQILGLVILAGQHCRRRQTVWSFSRCRVDAGGKRK